MRCDLSMNQLMDLVNHQLKSIWGEVPEGLSLEERSDFMQVLDRCDQCFSKMSSPYIQGNGEASFHIEHTVQYAVFLYFLSNELYKAGKTQKASFVYYLNKVMHGVDWFYAIDLPQCFFAEHPVGSVLGRANYGNYFFFYQGVTVGGNRKDGKLALPQIGDYVTMLSDSKALGDARVGNHVILAANAYVKDVSIPDYSLVFGQSPNLIIKPITEEKIRQMTGDFWM